LLINSWIKVSLAMSEGRRFYYRATSLLLKERLDLNREVIATLCMTKR